MNYCFFSIFLLSIQFSFSQGSLDYNGGFKIKFNDDGSKYLRILSWGQFQATYNDNVPDNTSNLSFNVRRARVLMFSQITKKFLLLTHFGLNSLNSSTLHPVGKGDGTQLFMHDVWGQWSLTDDHAVDAFYDASIIDNGSGINAYATFQSNNHGEDYIYSAYGTGSMFYAHVGYVVPGDLKRARFQPYVSYGSNSYDALSDNRNVFGVGGNLYLSGHNSKLTLEYKNQKFVGDATGTVAPQAMIYL